MKLMVIMFLGSIASVVACTENVENYYQETASQPDNDSGVNDMALPGSPGNRKKSWSASGKLTQKGRIQEVSLQCDFKDAPENYTAQFKLIGDLRAKRAQAEITWSVEGNQVRRLISIADGTSIQGTGQNVTIKIRDVSDPAVVTIGNGEYIACVNVVRGTRGSTSNPPQLDLNELENIAAGGNFIFDVPQNAGVTAVAVPFSTAVGGAAALQSIQVNQLDDSLNVLKSYDPRQYFWVPISPGCSKLQVFNYSAVQINAAPVYGIDG